jgi:hypothetical protein
MKGGCKKYYSVSFEAGTHGQPNTSLVVYGPLAPLSFDKSGNAKSESEIQNPKSEIQIQKSESLRSKTKIDKKGKNKYQSLQQ